MSKKIIREDFEHGLLAPLEESEAFNALRGAAERGDTPVLAAGVAESQKWHLAAGLMQTGRPAMVVCASEIKAKEICGDLSYFFGDRACLYPSRDVLFYSAEVKSADITRRRFSIIEKLLDETAQTPLVVLSAEALTDRLTPPQIFSEHIIELEVGGTADPDALARRLAALGYERAVMVEGPGQFAVRGGIMDVFPPGVKNGAADAESAVAVRLEFFGDEIDSIRCIDAVSQRSVSNERRARIFPMRELVYDDKTLAAAVARIEDEYKRAHGELRKKNLRIEAQALTETVQETLARLNESMRLPNIESYFNFFYSGGENLLDYLPKDTIIFFDEPNKINAHMEPVFAEFLDSIENRLKKGALLPSQAEMILPYGRVVEKAAAFDCVLLTTVLQSIKDFAPKKTVEFDVKVCPPFKRQLSVMEDELAKLIKQRYAVVILAGLRRHGQPLADAAADAGLPARYTDSFEDAAAVKGVVTVSRGAMNTGFLYTDIKLAVFTDKDFLTESADKKKKRRRFKEGAKIEQFTDLRVGDHVVHENHGIAVYQGMEQIVADGISRDYLKLRYADGGHLYVQTGQLEMIQKYIGGSNADGAPGRIKLSKLGGADWQKAKSRAKGAVAILAGDLAALYAKRQTAEGYAYGTDTVWQTEFEARFPYEETDDQLAAFDDVKHDMESGKVMDRLICGDVGYGKTEVAIRAAFKAVQDNKQVAYLVPTTILAQQHYHTFTSRLKDYPVTVERLSRFQTQREQKITVSNLAKGKSDIVIGTHRLLSADVSFHNLGLVIVDEEQRFGVSHKEKLKSLRANVNVLTLTATPIPRTLHLSMTGLRDMSLLNEPPLERLPVQTYVMEYNGAFVRDAVNRELARGGQVYYLHNRVRNIAEETARVAALVPSAKIAYAHGQMSENELENVMMRFVEGEIEVLVCTTIVETGLDIPNVNTIIIQNADYMGLSQLYQLRGRVGRSSRQAYAYLMYKKDKMLDENAEKRLQTIREFTEFGSGFKIAMRDLEIRGAGNLLGAEQHGHMDLVGYDMYCKLLAEAVAEIKGEPVKESFETAIDLAVNAYIPMWFIEDEMQKLEAYKKIALIENEGDLSDIQEEIEDRFGDLPRPVQLLLDIALLKAGLHSIGVVGVKQKQKGLIITFKANASCDPNKLAGAFGLAEYTGRLFYTSAPNPYVTFFPQCLENQKDGDSPDGDRDAEMIAALSGLLAKLK
ncbi:MAG: transcription-repair coupling factor [Defluviitaleaceae bacterium]|nr:transcription-repair coupling factor [Defluviitaleaceae bacterium]